MGNTHDRPWRTAAARQHRYHAAAGGPVPAFPWHAVFDVHRISWFSGERGRIQGDGPRRIRTSHDGQAGAQVDSTHVRRRLRAGTGVLRLSNDGDSVVFVEIPGSVWTGPPAVRTDRSRVA